MKTIGELFTSLPNGAAVSSAIAQGEVTKVHIHNEVRLVTLWVTFGSLINCNNQAVFWRKAVYGGLFSAAIRGCQA